MAGRLFGKEALAKLHERENLTATVVMSTGSVRVYIRGTLRAIKCKTKDGKGYPGTWKVLSWAYFEFADHDVESVGMAADSSFEIRICPRQTPHAAGT